MSSIAGSLSVALFLALALAATAVARRKTGRRTIEPDDRLHHRNHRVRIIDRAFQYHREECSVAKRNAKEPLCKMVATNVVVENADHHTGNVQGMRMQGISNALSSYRVASPKS